VDLDRLMRTCFRVSSSVLRGINGAGLVRVSMDIHWESQPFSGFMLRA
jgi:hypothetical protein